MTIANEIKKAMIDSDIKGAKQLSELSGVSYEKTLRLLKGDQSVRLKDAITTADALGLNFKFVSAGG